MLEEEFINKLIDTVHNWGNGCTDSITWREEGICDNLTILFSGRGHTKHINDFLARNIPLWGGYSGDPDFPVTVFFTDSSTTETLTTAKELYLGQGVLSKWDKIEGDAIYSEYVANRYALCIFLAKQLEYYKK